MPPSRGRADAGVLAAGLKLEAVSSSSSISARKIFVSTATARGRSASKPRSRWGERLRFGTEITHCRTGTGLSIIRSTATRSITWVHEPGRGVQVSRHEAVNRLD
jgi:hypothetical protein